MFCLVPLALVVVVAFYEVNIPVKTAFRAIWKPEKSEKSLQFEMRIGWEWWYLWAKVTTDHSPRWLPDIYTESLPTSQYMFKVSTWNHFRCPSDCTKQSGEHFHTVTVTIYCELLPCLDSIYGPVWIAGQIPTLNSNHLHPKLWEKKGNWRKRQIIILGNPAKTAKGRLLVPIERVLQHTTQGGRGLGKWQRSNALVQLLSRWNTHYRVSNDAEWKSLTEDGRYYRLQTIFFN